MSDWPASTADGQARLHALAVEPVTNTPTQVIDYRSRGRLLIIDGSDRAAAIIAGLSRELSAWTVTPPGTIPGDTPAPATLSAQVLGVAGHFGEYTVTVAGTNGEQINLARVMGVPGDTFDLVLDLGTPPQFSQDVPPIGYYAPADDADVLAAALEELNGLSGDFEKPKYYRYDPALCAHDRSGQRGCRRCIDACPTLAIASSHEAIEVDPYLCQGGGSCASACPSGAITYAYPIVDELLEHLRGLLNVYADSGGSHPCLLFYDGERGRAIVAGARASLPEHVLAIEIEEIGSIGLDSWLAALAFGAAQVVLLAPPATPASVTDELQRQLSYGHGVLGGLGIDATHVQLARSATPDTLVDNLSALRAETICREGFATFGEKRNTMYTAIGRLAASRDTVPDEQPLPDGAPFGEILVDQSLCTLCFACASICPAGALITGSDTPQLRFIESKCVQCGLCENTCPESAVTRRPRIVYDTDRLRLARTLYEEQPFMCLDCGKPFATRRIIDTMLARLEGHSMFSEPGALDRLKLCEDCRVKDMLRAGGGDAGLN